MQRGINEWNWMENATCSWGCRQCTLLQGMWLNKRKQPDLDGIFLSATVPSLLETIPVMAVAQTVTAALKELSYCHENPLKPNGSNSADAGAALCLSSLQLLETREPNESNMQMEPYLCPHTPAMHTLICLAII